MTGADIPYHRLYGLMQSLMQSYFMADDPPPGEARDVVTTQDALDALMQIGVTIDQQTQSGALPPERGLFLAGCLMAVREHIQPMPSDPTGGFAKDLAEVVKELRTVRAPDAPPSEWS